MLGLLKKAKVARVVPAVAVAAILAFSFLASAGASVGIQSLVGYGPCNSANLTASPLMGQAEGGSVTLTATSTGCPFPEYKFFLQSPGGSFAVARGYGGNTFVWNTTGAKDGFWGIGVWVRNVGHSASYESYFIGTYRILANCVAAGITTSPVGHAAKGTVVTLTGSSMACSHPQYRFWVMIGKKWVAFGPYSSSTTKAWATGNYHFKKGRNMVGVWARQTGSTHAYDSYQIITFYLQ